MNEVIEAGKNLSPFIPLIKPIYDEFLKPKLKQLEKTLDTKRIKNEIYDYKLLGNNFNDYLVKTTEKCSILNTLIFPNQQINIERLYQPLTLININGDKMEMHKVESYPSNLFETYKKILVTDNAGMGKSTLSKFICLQVIKEKIGIPVFIELRKITSKNTILNEFLKQINSIHTTIEKKLILELLKLGEFVIVLDGYDEISNTERNQVTQDLKVFIQECKENYFLLTSRPEAALSTFGEFKSMSIKGLDRNEAVDLMNKFDNIGKTNLTTNLFQEIKEKNNQVSDFLTNPFLVSLLFKTYSFKRDIPSRKSTFYNEVYTALYQDHDLSKESFKRAKNSNLDIQDFRLVLRKFADHTAKKGEIEYERQKAISYLTECKKALSYLEFKEIDFIEDLLTTVPLFTMEGNSIKWAHKSLQDYFAAEFITYHTNKKEIVNHLIKKDVRKYFNIIDLIIEMDPILIRQFVLPSILKNYITHHNSIDLPQKLSQSEISQISLYTFETKFWICKNLHRFKNSEDPDLEFERVNNYILEKFNIKPESISIINDLTVLAQNTSNIAIFFQLLGNKGLLGKPLAIKLNYEEKSLFEILPDFPTPLENFFKNKSMKINHFHELNEKLNFSFRNKNYGNSRPFIPNIKVCIDLLNKIESEINTSPTEDFLSEY